jgi:hypothetical protein
MGLEAGSGILRVSADATDQLVAATRSASAPDASIGTSPRPRERLTSTATPPIPIASANASRMVSLCVPRKRISERAMNAGMVAIMTAVIPDGTRRSAQKTIP